MGDMTPLEYHEQHILANLLGEAPIDWKAAEDAYSVAGFKPSNLKIVERDDFMKGLVNVAAGTLPEDRARDDATLLTGTRPQKLLRALARQYCALRNKGARLPKFSKWCSSLFKDDKDLAVALADYCRAVGGVNDKFIISCNPVDILRAADTKHYWSCLDDKGAFRDVLPGVVEKCPGIAVVYVNGPDGKMKGRSWLHHVVADGVHGVYIANGYGNGLTVQELREHFKKQGVPVFESTYGGTGVRGEFIGAFKANIHWDTCTWRDAHFKKVV